PATMELLGDANWWFPKWLDWIPKFHLEGSPLPEDSLPPATVDSPTREPQPVG
ncbi:MAG: hypothetical protein QOK39_2614, partial [Acidimicrobiaceae bacterium]|nr:hypothetical protein [Acidimicrobiaceae bacterium]